MGDVADMLIDGTLCEDCGAVIDDDSPGHPRCCNDCERERGIAAVDSAARTLAAETRVTCRQCGKRVKYAGLRDHQRDKHGVTK